MSRFRHIRQSLTRNLRASAREPRKLLLARHAQFIFEWLQPRILFSGLGTSSPASGPTQVVQPAINVNQPPTVSTPAAAFPSTIYATTTSLSVMGADDGGESNLTYTWATTGSPPAPVTFSANGTNAAKNVTATFTRAGGYAFQVTITDSGGRTTTSNVSVLVTQTAAQIVVSPSSASVHVSQQQQFSVTELDQFGQAMAQQPTFTWSLLSGGGSLSSSGLYTAPGGVGSATVAAAAGSLTGSASVSIQNSAPVISQAAAASPSTVTGTSTNLSVAATDDGGAGNLTYQWSVLSKPSNVLTPTFSNIGAASTTATFHAAGTYQFQATVTDSGGLTATSVVSVTVQQTFTGFAISPPASMATSSTQQLSATGVDQFGNAMALPSGTQWQASNGGSITQGGLLTSSHNTGTEQITISKSGTQAQTNVTVVGSGSIVAAPATVTGTSTTLTAIGMGGGLGYNFAWTTTNKPTGAASPTFSVNNTAGASTVVTFSHAGTYTFQVTVTDLLIFQSSATVTVTVSQTLSSISVTPATVSIGENGSQTFAATAYDQFGNAMSSQPGFNWAVTSGGGAISSTSGQYTAPSSPGAATVTAISGGVSGSAGITVTNAAPTVATAAANLTASPIAPGQANLSVLGADSGGESSLTYTWTATGTPPGTVGFSSNGTNAAKNTNVWVSAAGTYHFQVTISDPMGLTAVSTVNVTFVADPNQPPTISVPSGQQTNENSSLTFSAGNSNQITITNPGNLTEQVTLNSTNGLMTLASTSGLTFNLGSGTNSSMMVFSGSPAAVNAALNGITFTPGTNQAGLGGIQIGASVGSGRSAFVNLPITIVPLNVAPTVATAAQAAPTPVTGTSTSLSVLGADDGGEDNLTYSWSATSKPAGAANPSFSLNGSNAAKNTVATFSAAGNYTLLATITDAGGLSTTSSVSVTVNQTLTTISVTPGSPSLGAGATQQFSAVGLDQFGQSMVVQPSFTWTQSAGLVDSTGFYTAPGSPMSATVTATSGSVQGVASVTVVSNGAAIATPGEVSGTTTNLSVLGGATTGVIYTWSVLTQPTGATAPDFSDNGDATAQSITATFHKAGSYTFQVDINNGSDTTQTVVVTVDQTVTTIAVSPGTANLNENQQQQFSAVADDQFGNAMASQPTFSWAVVSGLGAIDGTGLYASAGSGGAGSATISATAGSVSGTATISVTNATPTVAIAPSASSSPVMGTSTVLSVLGADDGGESNLNYSWSTLGSPPGNVLFSVDGNNAAKETTAQFSTAGTYQFTVIISDANGKSVSANVTVDVEQTVTGLTISPTSTTMHLNAQQQFTATAVDQFGNAMTTTPPMIWSITSGNGAIDGSGLYTSPGTPGAADITVSSGSVQRTATVTIANAPPTVATPAAASSTTVSGATTNLSVLGADDGGEPNLTYTWSTTGTPPATVIFSANGTNASKDTMATFSAPGTYHLLATIVDAQGASVTSAVTVQVVSTFSQIIVTPAGSSIERGGSAQFAASAVDQFGSPLASQPTFSWSTLGNIGSIDSSGAYTAPDAGIGNATIIATSGGMSGSTTVALNDQLAAIVPGSQTATPGQPLVFSNGNLISIVDGDANTQSVPVSLTLTATGGTISLAQLAGLTLLAGTGANDSTVTLSGGLPSIDSALNGLTFTPNNGFAGSGSIAVTINELGASQASPTRTVGIFVGAAASTPPPTTTAAAPVTGPSAPAADNSVLTGVLNQPTTSINSSTDNSSQSTSGSTNSVFSNEPITASYTVSGDGSAPASATPADPAAPAGQAAPNAAPANPEANAGHGDGAAAKAVAAQDGKSAPPPSSAVHNSPSAASMVPDKEVHTVPDQVFTFLAPQSAMLKNLDTVKTDMTSQKSLKVAAGSATVMSFGASAAYLVWLLRGGSLLSSLLSIFPAWKSMDPLPVLEQFEKSRRKKRNGKEDDDESLESLVEKSNLTEDGKTATEPETEPTGKNQ